MLIMRTKYITDCFEIGRLVGFLITNSDIMAMCPCIAHIYCGGAALAGAIKDGWQLGGHATGKAGPGTP